LRRRSRAREAAPHVYPVDLADLDAVVATTNAIKADEILPDVIVNNAGIGL
jgi:short-subunit dehydrogenase